MASYHDKPITFIATLGGQPQVVTFALDALLAQPVLITDVIVLHPATDEPRLQRSLQNLTAEFDHRYPTIKFCPHPIYAGQQLLHDIHDETDANSVWEAINQLLARLKLERRTLHIAISGGRRILGLLTMSAAMLHFGHQDVLWHMYTPDDIRREANEGAMLHLPPNSGFRLIRVPMMPWGSYFPQLRQLAQPVNTIIQGDVLARSRAAMDAAEWARCRAVAEQLTRRQRDVLRCVASGLTPQETADVLHITLATVDSHKTVIYELCRQAWSVPPTARLDYRFLAEKFEAYFEERPMDE